MIYARYYVRLKNPYGVPVAWISKFESIQFQKKVDDIGSYSITFIDDDDPMFDLFQLDGQVEIYRSIPELGLEWYAEFEGLIRKWTYAIDNEGKKTLTVSGPDYNELLSRKIVAYKAGTVRADKNTDAETAIKEYVEENCGPTADDTVVGRLYQGGLAGFSVEPSYGNGDTWVGSRAFDNVLDVCKDIAAASGLDFEVIGVGNGKYLFRTGNGLLGKNRTTTGSTSGNLVNIHGNKPFVFSIDSGNVKNLEYADDRQKEINVVVVPGKGDGSTRHTVTVWDEQLIDDSPINIREVGRTASSYNEDMETYSLTQIGLEAIAENKPKSELTFSPVQMVGSMYGMDYWYGDIVVIRYKEIDKEKKISEVNINVTGFQEEVTLQFMDAT